MNAVPFNSVTVLAPTHDMDARPWMVSLQFRTGDAEPLVKLHSRLNYDERYEYLVSTVVEAAAEGRGFHFGHGASEKTMHRLSNVATAAIAAEAISRIPGTVGRIEVRWVPNDPRVPF